METGLIEIQELRAFLTGAWDLTRTIEDHLTDKPGRLVGRAVFLPGGDCLHYTETGRLKTADFDDEVQRRYLFRFPEPHLAIVFFTDEREFHDLDLRSGTWTTRHRCNPDVYDGAFFAQGSDVWRSQWRIEGPRKDMTIRNTYTRNGGSAAPDT